MYINSTLDVEPKEIYWLDELTKECDTIVGKKCSNLGELIKLGLRVPQGFAISVKAYEYFMDATGLKRKIEKMVQNEIKDNDIENNILNLIPLSDKIRKTIMENKMPPILVKKIENYYRDLQKNTGISELGCAVRSSGAVSMPGQMETYLNIKGEAEIVEHVKKVWASAFTTRAIAYRLKNKMSVSWCPIGVAVIMMLEAKSAGVILTVLPNTGDLNCAVVEGNFGLGESLVSGEITPDSFVVDKKGLYIESKVIAIKNRMIVNSNFGTETIAIPVQYRKKACLENNEVLEIVRAAKYVEEYFGYPQDMEWVIDRRYKFPENIFWVQARKAKYNEEVKKKDDEYVIELMLQLFKN